MAGCLSTLHAGLASKYQKVVAPKLEGLIIERKACNLKFLDNLSPVSSYVPHHPTGAKTGVTAKVDQCQATIRTQGGLNRVEHLLWTPEMMVGIGDEDQVHAVWWEIDTLLRVNDRHDIVEPSGRSPRLDRLDEDGEISTAYTSPSGPTCLANSIVNSPVPAPTSAIEAPAGSCNASMICLRRSNSSRPSRSKAPFQRSGSACKYWRLISGSVNDRWTQCRRAYRQG